MASHYNSHMQCLMDFILKNENVDIQVAPVIDPIALIPLRDPSSSNPVYRATIGVTVAGRGYLFVEQNGSSQKVAKQSAAAKFIELFYPEHRLLERKVVYNSVVRFYQSFEEL